MNNPKNKELSDFEKSMPRKVFPQDQCTDAVVQEAQAISLDCSNALPLVRTLLAQKLKWTRGQAMYGWVKVPERRTKKPLCAAVELKPRFQSWRLQMLELSVPCNTDQEELKQWNGGNLVENLSVLKTVVLRLLLLVEKP